MPARIDPGDEPARLEALDFPIPPAKLGSGTGRGKRWKRSGTLRGLLENAPSQGVLLINLIAAALNVPLCLILIRLIRRLTRAQVLARQVSAFA